MQRSRATGTEADRALSADRERFVVGYDASPAAEEALAWAARSSVLQSLPLQVRVVASAMDPVFGSTRAIADLYANRRLAHALNQLHELGIDRAHLAVVHGPVFPTLLQESGRRGVLVVGSDGHGLIAGELHGSVSQHIARSAHGSVVVVRRADPSAQTLVVGYDGRDAANRALRWTAERAAVTGERVLALTVVTSSRLKRRLEEPLPAHDQARFDLAVLRLRRELGGLRRAYPGVSFDAEVVNGALREVLVRHSAHASLLALGAYTHDPVVELALGSTVQHLLTHGQCPVALFRPDTAPVANVPPGSVQRL